ncbi:MAG: dockerin type I domain-containing protein [Candidatus Sumerlaeota bacterium]|nr:dockerin type I domain-containing protein [Candidatus Sumerlaeota bacterium]
MRMPKADLIRGLVIFLLLTAAPSFGAMPGDVTNDDQISTEDVAALHNFLTRTSIFQGNADVNGDGRVDISDLVNLVQALFSATRASFVDATSTASEEMGIVYIPITFSRPIYGLFKYRIANITTADASDYTTAGYFMVNGDSTSIPITLTDNMIVQPMRTIVLDILPDLASGYWQGGIPRHTLLVMDNDSYWTGVMKNGLTELAFRLRILQNATSLSLTLVSSLDPASSIGVQGIGNIPSGQWGMNGTLSDAAQVFHATSVEIPMGTARLFDRTPISRTLTFDVSPDHTVYLYRKIFMLGEYTDTVKAASSGARFLDTQTTGVLALVKDFPTLPARTVPTQPLP